ncbi:MAG TPA: bifunctional 3-demethylubiquinol 3-O-methyltransferase/2-polyprenyl-6-hydroxyphenol methylase [Holosporales bacterium]|nr:bifunctional 3-demethylubiquinol 3-O-methyltransferase/2-polyprenyl-6-hydroxyphenol methylase [Holosporales bacterium]
MEKKAKSSKKIAVKKSNTKAVSKTKTVKVEAPIVESVASVMPEAATVNVEQVNTFNDYAGNPWDENGPLKPLHQLNPVRLSFIKDHLTRIKKLDTDSGQPYKELSILDVGCGPGLLSEPLARLGAHVTGIDASDHFLKAAVNHAAEQKLSIDYQLSSIEDTLKKSKKYDVVCALEVIEHVDNVDRFLQSCMELLKSDGVLFISTLNRTFMSYLKAIVLAENILKWVPTGTHDWKRFLTPAEIAHTLREGGFYFADLKGIDFHPLKQEWHLTSSLNTNYIGCAVKR